MKVSGGCTNGPTNPCSLLFETKYMEKAYPFGDSHAGVLGLDDCYLGTF